MFLSPTIEERSAGAALLQHMYAVAVQLTAQVEQQSPRRISPLSSPVSPSCLSPSSSSSSLSSCSSSLSSCSSSLSSSSLPFSLSSSSSMLFPMHHCGTFALKQHQQQHQQQQPPLNDVAWSLEQQAQFRALLEERNRALVRLKDIVENACFDAPMEAHFSVRLFKYLFDQGDAFALYLMGTCFLSGLGGLNQDVHLAIRLFQAASDRGIQHAKNALGGIYYNMAQNAPETCAKTYEKTAVKYFMDAAEAGNAFAQSNMGFVYDRGVGGVEVNSEKALYWYRQALLSNDPVALNNAGLIYLEGALNVPPDNETAVKFFQASAAQGNCAGITSLGVAFEYGHGGLTPDKLRALELYRRAARHGHPDALANVACMYWKGEAGLPVDHSKALYLYELSAQFKSDPANYQLGCLRTLLKNSNDLEKALQEADQLYQEAVFGPSYGAYLFALLKYWEAKKILLPYLAPSDDNPAEAPSEFQFYTKRFTPWQFRESSAATTRPTCSMSSSPASAEESYPKKTTTTTDAEKGIRTFFGILRKIPIELQLAVCQAACADRRFVVSDSDIFLESCKVDLYFQLEAQDIRHFERSPEFQPKTAMSSRAGTTPVPVWQFSGCVNQRTIYQGDFDGSESESMVLSHVSTHRNN